MKPPIVEHSEPITLIGGGDVGENDLNLASSVAPTLVAADGGADLAVAQGHMPQAVIGDFDSVSDDVQRLVPPERLFPVREQETTDFDKALRHIHAPLVVGVGFLGGRVDHQLAVLNTLVRRAATPCVLLGAHEVLFHAPPRIELALDPGSVVSLFPLARVNGRSSGLEWPIDQLTFDPSGQIGTSNRSTGPVTLEMDQPGLLVMVPRGAFDLVMQAFRSTRHVPWPAHAG
ncbi:Thiamin pyrophosphokinase, catalytic domain [Falsiruegeria litorea R37]|uniref:Thiamine diphosphokinase n=1 Tax=Falsiruegeria litorea R37 TaxID=1200284 RepID=A0A1Y5T7R5_9RHOB|nr:thiamine diphosphokinase [Falsiruegeria litorea]SLN57722.1 Thiamin pyrophosphokinase, catalytic domain [Falsiruegeria litorea R37]